MTFLSRVSKWNKIRVLCEILQDNLSFFLARKPSRRVIQLDRNQTYCFKSTVDVKLWDPDHIAHPGNVFAGSKENTPRHKI